MANKHIKLNMFKMKILLPCLPFFPCSNNDIPRIRPSSINGNSSCVGHMYWFTLGSSLSLIPHIQCIGIPMDSSFRTYPRLLRIRASLSNGLQSPTRYPCYLSDLLSHQSPLDYSHPARISLSKRCSWLRGFVLAVLCLKTLLPDGCMAHSLTFLQDHSIWN